MDFHDAGPKTGLSRASSMAYCCGHFGSCAGCFGLVSGMTGLVRLLFALDRTAFYMSPGFRYRGGLRA